MSPDALDGLIAAGATDGLAAVYAAAVAQQDAPDPGLAREARRTAARAALALGDREAAIRHAEDALAIAQAAGDDAAIQADLALLTRALGSLAEAIAALADGDAQALQARGERSPFAADPAYQAALGMAVTRARREARLQERPAGPDAAEA